MIIATAPSPCCSGKTQTAKLLKTHVVISVQRSAQLSFVPNSLLHIAHIAPDLALLSMQIAATSLSGSLPTSIP